MVSSALALSTAAWIVVETTTTAASAEKISAAAQTASAAANVSLPMDSPSLDTERLFTDTLRHKRCSLRLDAADPERGRIAARPRSENWRAVLEKTTWSRA